MQPRLLAFVVLLVPGAALAQQQLVTFDQVVTITQQGNGSGAYHYTIKPAATEPASWTTPVDYSKGTAYVHLDVMSKPSKRNTTITICFDGNLAGYGCLTSGTYTDVGKHDTVRNLPRDTWQYGQIAWGRRRQEYHLVVKDPALGGTPGGRPPSDYVPTTMRVVMTVVPPGGTYTPPPGVGGPAADGGAAPDSGTTGTPPADAAPDPMATPDAGAPPAKPDAAPAVAKDAASSPPPKGEDPPEEEEEPTSKPPAPSSGGGCSVSGAASGAGPAMLAAFVVPALLRRKRRSRH